MRHGAADGADIRKNRKRGDRFSVGAQAKHADLSALRRVEFTVPRLPAVAANP